MNIDRIKELAGLSQITESAQNVNNVNKIAADIFKYVEGIVADSAAEVNRGINGDDLERVTNDVLKKLYSVIINKISEEYGSKKSSISESTAAIEKNKKLAAQRQQKLKQEILDGKQPIVMAASGHYDPNTYTFGDLEALGWARKEYIHDPSGEVDGLERKYTGPNPIRVEIWGESKPRVLKRGEWV